MKSCSGMPEALRTVQLKKRDGQRLVEGVLAALLPARDEVVALRQRRREVGDLGRVVLAVAVHGDDVVAARGGEAVRERRRLAEVAPQLDDAHVVTSFGELLHDRERAVAWSRRPRRRSRRGCRARASASSISATSGSRLSASLYTGMTSERRPSIRLTRIHRPATRRPGRARRPRSGVFGLVGRICTERAGNAPSTSRPAGASSSRRRERVAGAAPLSPSSVTLLLSRPRGAGS